VGDQYSDLLRREEQEHTSKKEFVLYNNLHVNVKVVHEIPYPKSVTTIDVIKPNSFLKILPGQIKDNDIFHFIYESDKTSSTFACPSVRVKLHLGGIVIGSIVSAQGGYNRDIHFNGDISSVRIHNMLAWPILLHLNGKKVAYIDKNNELGTYRHGDQITAPHIYFDNSNKGLKINDVFEIEIVENGTGNARKWKTFVISDRYISEIFIGQPTTQVSAHNPKEVYFYRLDGNKINPKNNSNTSAIWPGVTPTGHNNKIPIKRYGVVNK
jgi:hypothetical protein